MRIKVLYLLLIITITIFSCKQENVEENKSKQVIQTKEKTTAQENSVKNSDNEEVKTIFYNLPSPLELSNLLEKAGAAYEPELLNSVSNKDKYTTNTSVAINLGIYGADLSYTRMLDQVQGTLNYLNVVRELSQKLGIPQTEKVFALDRLEENLENKDSLLQIINDLYSVADIYLKESERHHASTYVIIGGWVEGLYLACNLVNQENPNEEIMVRIAEQKYSIKILTDLCNGLPNDGTIELIKADFIGLKTIFDSIKVSQKEGEIITDSKQQHTNINTEIKIEMTMEELQKIKETITEIRNKFI